MEERDPTAQRTSEYLLNAFEGVFHSIQCTLHPSDISGEVAGKSSNVSWAAKELTRRYVDSLARDDCVITVMDCMFSYHSRGLIS